VASHEELILETLMDLKESQGKILEQVTKTNGRVTVLEGRADNIDKIKNRTIGAAVVISAIFGAIWKFVGPGK